MRTILFVAALILASCAPPSAPGGATAGDTATGSSKASDDEQSCSAKGGTMRRICLMGKMTCVLKYADGGKPCTGKKQCLGQCRIEGGKVPPASAPAVGACQRTTDPCGCFATVEDGKVQGMLCVD